jgi:hypothetical protein
LDYERTNELEGPNSINYIHDQNISPREIVRTFCWLSLRMAQVLSDAMKSKIKITLKKFSEDRFEVFCRFKQFTLISNQGFYLPYIGPKKPKKR